MKKTLAISSLWIAIFMVMTIPSEAQLAKSLVGSSYSAAYNAARAKQSGETKQETVSQVATVSQYESRSAIEVDRLSNWAPNYLTVINNYNNMCIEPYRPTLKYMSVVKSINGMSTEGMEPEEFYRILDQSPTFTLQYTTKSNGVNKDYTETFKKKNGRLLITSQLMDESAKPSTISILADVDVDFFKFNTFDYRLAGDDQLMDKSLMQVFADFLKDKGMKRVTDSPDIYLYVTKDVNNKIESIYVPKYTTTTNTGDTGVGFSNFLGVKGLNVGGSSGTATTETKDEGSMKTNVVADAYLEFSVLDAKKLDSKDAPVVWQLTYSEHRTSEIRLLEAVKTWIGGWMNQYPFSEPCVSSMAYTWGVFCNDFATDPTISDIVEGSKATQFGCKVGDKIKYVKYESNDDYSTVYRPGQSFYASKIIPTAIMMNVGKSKISKGGLTQIVNYNYIYK